ncbi:type II secretion system minor pseudopilin GspK [Parendozoicomonas haliclonae]|uniref:Type II secretion system protein K n=1 Tax=Parendozoicomonas haliclonae TaxID=1960125 RepID=A0A1X7AGU4_9GAMM|nr:type II secretion system minor pseudopilin GspK [Parendozoicomonas haliclonae]SMA39503.1 putative type II secretion system protein K [Parendozoicomonas haliclonae]
MRQQRGVALLTVLLIVAMMALLMSEITFGFRNQVRNATTGAELDQARWYARSAEELAIQILHQTFTDDGDVIHLGQAWATEGMVFPVEYGVIAGSIIDAQSCFNLNALDIESLDDAKAAQPLQIFTTLLDTLEVDSGEAEDIARATRDWMNAGADNIRYGDSTYLGRPLPSLTGRTLMRDNSEWRTIEGVNAALARKVMPYLCALPTRELLLNVNTISAEQPELLSALFQERLAVNEARDILENRPVNGWSSVSDFIGDSQLGPDIVGEATPHLTTESAYFLVKASARAGESETGIISLLYRMKNKGLSVVSRKSGALM